jgi:hypothetical protein
MSHFTEQNSLSLSLYIYIYKSFVSVRFIIVLMQFPVTTAWNCWALTSCMYGYIWRTGTDISQSGWWNWVGNRVELKPQSVRECTVCSRVWGWHRMVPSLEAGERSLLEATWLGTAVCVLQWFVRCSHELYKSPINPTVNPKPRL